MCDRNRLTNFRLNERLLAALKEKAARDGTTATAIVRSALARETGLAA